MIRKALFTLSMLMGIALVAACSPAQTASTPVPNMPNPAAVYCEQQGGKPEIVTAADGSQSGLCAFPDGSQCDEWAYLRGECKPGDSLMILSPRFRPRRYPRYRRQLLPLSFHARAHRKTNCSARGLLWGWPCHAMDRGARLAPIDR